MRVAHVITGRPHLAGSAVATALTFADVVVVGLHGFSAKYDDPAIEVVTGPEYVALTNEVLAVAATFSDHTLRVDDDDYYPAGHEQVLDYWEPGTTVWGEVTIKGCDGRILQRNHPDMCAGVLPTGITLTGDRMGRVADSLRLQTRPVIAPTGVVKQVCLADANWFHSPRWKRIIDCSHTARVRAIGDNFST